MAQWDGIDANRVRQTGLINSSPRLGAVLHHRPSPAGSGSKQAAGAGTGSWLPESTEGTDCSGWGKTTAFPPPLSAGC